MPIKLKGSNVVPAYTSIVQPATDYKYKQLRAREALINEISAWISLTGLVWLLFDEKAMLFEFQTWQHFMPTARNPATVQQMNDFELQIEGSCDIPGLTVAHLEVQAKRDGVVQTYYALPLGFEAFAIYPSFFLICVLLWSAGFQSYRSSMLNRSLHQMENCHHLSCFEFLIVSSWLAVVAHVLLWVKVYSLKTPAVADGTKLVFLAGTTLVAFLLMLSGYPYWGNGSDFGRWIEYVLTSPLQIFLIACSVWRRDRAMLYALFAAQANLIICGALIELCFAKIYSCQTKADSAGQTEGVWSTTAHASDSDSNEDTHVDKALAKHEAYQRKGRRAMWVTLFELVLVWFSFSVIWYIIISQFQRQKANAGACDACAKYEASTCPTRPLESCELAGGKCQGRDDIPPAVFWIISTQCLLFGLFGVVQSVQIYLSRNVVSKALARRTWYMVSYYYAILSVTAKSALEIGFLVMLSQMPSAVRKA